MAYIPLEKREILEDKGNLGLFQKPSESSLVFTLIGENEHYFSMPIYNNIWQVSSEGEWFGMPHAVEKDGDVVKLVFRRQFINLEGIDLSWNYFFIANFELVDQKLVHSGFESPANPPSHAGKNYFYPLVNDSDNARLQQLDVDLFSDLEEWVAGDEELKSGYGETGLSGYVVREHNPNKNGFLEEWAFDKYQNLFPNRPMLQGFGVSGELPENSDAPFRYLRTELVVTSTWSDTVRINLEKTGSPSDSVIQAKQVTKGEHADGWVGSIVTGSSGDDIIRGLAGFDQLFGKAGDDLIHGGNGRDIIDGGSGSDELHGDFGWNTYKDQQDGSKDLIAIKSDQHLSNFWYGKAGNSPNGEKADFIEGLDDTDEIKIIGVATKDLSFKDGITTKGVSGIGIYAKGALEAVYTGGNLSLDQISQMTTGDDSAAAMANQMWSYWGDNTAPALLA